MMGLPPREVGQSRLVGSARRHPVLALFLCSVALRAAVAAATRVVGLDEALMFGYGTSWLRTGVYSGIQWPVPYPLVVAALGWIVGGWLAVKLVFVLVGSLAVVPFHRAWTELRGEGAAGWGTLTMVLLPAFGVVVAKSGSHSLFFPLIGLAFLLHVRALRAATAGMLLALGFVLGFAYVTRADGIVFLAVVAASFLVLPTLGSLPVGVLERMRRMSLVLAGGLACVVPNVLHVHHYTGRYQLSTMAGHLAEHPYFLVGAPDQKLVQMGEELEQAEGGTLQRLAAHPGYLARKMAYNARQMLRLLGDATVFPAALFALVGIGLTRLLGTRPAVDGTHGGGRVLLLLAIWCVPPLAYLALNAEPRYLSTTAIFLALSCGDGWVGLCELLSGRRGAFAAVLACVAAFLLALTAMQAGILRQIEEPLIAEKAAVVIERAGDALRQTFVYDPQVRFLVDGRVRAARSAPLTEEPLALLYVVDPSEAQLDERARFDALRSRGGSFTQLPSELGLEIWERER